MRDLHLDANQRHPTPLSPRESWSTDRQSFVCALARMFGNFDCVRVCIGAVAWVLLGRVPKNGTRFKAVAEVSPSGALHTYSDNKLVVDSSLASIVETLVSRAGDEYRREVP